MHIPSLFLDRFKSHKQHTDLINSVFQISLLFNERFPFTLAMGWSVIRDLWHFQVELTYFWSIIAKTRDPCFEKCL